MTRFVSRPKVMWDRKLALKTDRRQAREHDNRSLHHDLHQDKTR